MRFNSQLWKRRWFVLTLVLVLGALIFQLGSGAIPRALGAQPTAAMRVNQAWENVRNSAQYGFSADITITTIPLPIAENIGRFSQTDSLYLEGTNELHDNRLQMALWGGGVNVTDRAAAYQVRVEEGIAQTRVGAGEWQVSDERAIAFAPDGDFLAFLDMAKNVTLVSNRASADDEPNLERFTFELDSRAYAHRLSSLSQEQMVRNGQLPPGAAVQIPEHLTEISGTGELWIDARGLPVRQKVTMAIPAAADADYRTETVMEIYFTDYESNPPLMAAAPWLQSFVQPIANLDLPSPTATGATLALFSFSALAMVALIRPGRRTQFIVTTLTLCAIILTPVMQAQAATLASIRLNDAQAQQRELERANSLPQEFTDNSQSLRAAAPYAPPQMVLNHAAEMASLQSATLDSDADGLTDEVENLLGTDPLSKDSDGDTISDFAEITGFAYGGKQWYGNPLKADSNGDSVIDGLEWKPDAPDSDGDGTPDLYDFDDDGDGVADDIDISRLVGSKADDGQPITFSQTNPLQLQVDGLQNDSYTFVELQLRPTNPDQLWYAFNVLNWPKDEKGTMQDWDSKTFFDHCQKSGGVNCNLSPDANGDIKLVPMLEVAINDLSNLPRTANGALDNELLQRYGISVQPAGGGGYYLYAPLNLVEDRATGAKVAFNAQLLYQAGATWQPQQARLTWVVQALNETYASPEAANKVLKAGNGTGNNQVTVLHAYYTDFHLTGLNVREERGVEMAIVYEDPARDPALNDDDGLAQLAYGLQGSFLTNRDCDFVDNRGKCVGDGQRDLTIAEIKRRWDHPSNTGITPGQMWGLDDDYLRVETHNFRFADEATALAGSQLAPAILNANFTNSSVAAPTLLYVRETKFRAINGDVRSGSVTDGGATWNGYTLNFSLAGQGVTSTASYNLTPYRKTTQAAWETFPMAEYIAAIKNRYAPPTPPTATSSDQVILQEAEATYTAANIAVMMVGQSAVISTNATQNAYGGLTGALGSSFFVGADLSDAKLRQVYQQGVTAGASRLPQMFRMTAEGFLTTAILIDLFKLKGSIDVYEQTMRGQRAQNIRTAGVAFQGVLAVATIGGIIATTTEKGAVAGQIMLSSVNAISQVYDAITTYVSFSRIAAKGQFGDTVTITKVGLQKVLASSYSLKDFSAKMSAIGAAIGIGVAWGLFFAAWGTTGISAGSVAFNSLLAGAIASTLVVVITFFISISVVGSIILAVFAVFDLIALIICKAGVKLACSLGITEAITKVITDWIYTGSIMIDTQADPALTNIEDAQMHLTRPERGLVVGNSVRFEVELLSVARHAAPAPGIIYHFPSFYTPQDLSSTTVHYSLEDRERKLTADLNQTTWYYVQSYGWIESEVPSPVVGWLVPLVKSKTLYQGVRGDRLTSGLYQFNQAKINQTFPLYLNTGLALPRYDCWFQVCVHKAAKSSTSTDLGKQFILDILPATLEEFVQWAELGSQLDPDGDGLLAAVDPNNSKWDTDGDGLPDNIELRGGFDPRVADADNDGLNDAQESRYDTNPWQADTDGDGISDKAEIEGYSLTILGYTFIATSDPTRRDSDGDGMSDGIERRLNGIDPTRYPFHPGVFNVSPAQLSTTLEDADRVLAVGSNVIISTTVYNGTAVENSLLAAGVVNTNLPSQLGGASQNGTFSLLPTASKTLVLNGVAASANGTFSITSSMAADIVTLGTTPTGVPDDIILDDPLPVTIDSDAPAVPALTEGMFVQPGRSVIIGGVATDPTSYIAQVDVSIDGGAFGLATGTGLWAFPVAIPDMPGGSIPITVRAADAVNNINSANLNLTIDGVSPTLAVNLNAGEARQVRRNADGNWSLPLAGTVSDNLAGVDTLTVQIGDSSNMVLTRTAIAGGNWSLDYIFDDLAFNADPRPTGSYTLTVTARDGALPDGNPTTQTIPFVIDMTPPTVTLLSHKDELQITDGAVFTGTVQDANAAVQSVEVAFVSAQTALSTNNTLLRLPLNDLPETVLFENSAGTQTRIFCLDATCPTSGVAGADGSAVAFAGNDLLRTFETLDLPESGVTNALWFNTTCANCGLFSQTQGVYPTITQYDRELYLDAGKVCSSILVGASREVRCSVASTYADGAWHQIVHTLGANGNALYVDGQLVVSSPTTASSFTAQDGVLIGYAPSAATPFLTGALDDVVIYEGALTAEAAVSLYRQWQPVTFSNGEWSFPVPTGLEGYYQIDMRATDSAGNRGDARGDWPQFRGPIDTRFPTFDLNVIYSGSGSAAQTAFSSIVRDENLTTTDYAFVCPLSNDQLRYNLNAARLAFAGPSDQLMGIDARCVQTGFQNSQVAARACDAFGHCAAGVPPQTVAYIGTQANQTNPYGSLPNAIERTVLSDPFNRVQILQRVGLIITDLAVDESRGKIYWGEMRQGDYAQPGEIWRANLDGSAPQRLVTGLTVYAPEALQIALDPVGNKLYWTKADELWWANLDGTQPAVVYQIPNDPRFDNGNRNYHQIGDVMVDRTNNLLYLSERRNRFEGLGGIRIFNHSLIVRSELNGTNPTFVAGAGPGCTYANFYDNLGAGVGAGKDPILCVANNGGIDVESLTVTDGTLYWTAYAEGFGSSAVYGKPLNGDSFTVAPLALTGNSQGLRSTPLPHLAVAPGSTGVFVALEDQVVRGEPGGEFTQFSDFGAALPEIAGQFTRASSNLTALAVVRVPQSVQTQADLAVTLTSPDLVLINGETGRYQVQIRNYSAMPADDATVTLTLPDGGTFADASQPCTANGAVVMCALGRLAPQFQQTMVISFTLTTDSVRPLTTTVGIAHSFADANPADNTASHTNITAAPNLAALPGVPYLYAGNDNHLIRIPLLGTDHTPEPVLIENSSYGARAIAVDMASGKLIVNNTFNGDIATVNPDGTGYTVIADAMASPELIHDHRLAVAVDETAGRLYWTELNSFYLSAIKSANLDGSDVQTVVPQILNQRGLALDPLREKLLWVATDRSERQNLIYRSNLDGSETEVVYSAPVGQQIRYLSINPYAQKLYWIDPTHEHGSLFWADSDGQRAAVLHSDLRGDARGIVVRPLENALYFTSYDTIMRSDLDGSNLEELTTLSGERYYGVSNLDPAVFPYLFLSHPLSNLALATGTAFAPATCTIVDGNEPNDTPAQATLVGPGNFSAALCRSTSAAGTLDKDVYRVAVPAGQQITVTLNPPADYNLYLQLGDFTADVSSEPGNAPETVSVANYDDAEQEYTFTVMSASVAGSVTPYTVNVVLATAPPQTSFTNAQCAAVDSHDAPGAAGNGTQANATPLTVDVPFTGALCYEADSDFYKFSGTAGQFLSVDLPQRPADYPIYVYRPNGTLFNAYNADGAWRYGTQFTLDATGEWAVAVANPNLVPTLDQYQLLVSDNSCAVNDAHEPNNASAQAASIDGQSRIFATLCSAADQDYYEFSATAGQQLTINYPAGGQGTLVVQTNDGATIGQVAPGTQGTFTLVDAGIYRLLVTKSDLSGNDVPYMFQWLLDAPVVLTNSTPYVYYADFPHLTRVALSDDHTVEPILIDGGISSEAIAASTTLGKLFLVESNTRALISVDFDGRNRTVIIPDANPDNVGTVNIAVAVDDLGGRVYWLQPQGAVASTSVKLMSATLAGGDVQTLIPTIIDQRRLVIDPVKGWIYWVAGEAIHRAGLDGSNPQLVRAASGGQQVRDLALDPLAQTLYWLDPNQGNLLRANSDGSNVTTLVTGLGNDSRGLVLRPSDNELYLSSGGQMLRATLADSGTVSIATLGGQYGGPSNLDANSFFNTPIGPPDSNLVLGQGSPILSPCALADGYEPNNAFGSATPLSVITETVVYGALCNAVLGQPTDVDYYSVTVPANKTLDATLSQLPADYRLVIVHPDDYAAAFSENAGLDDEYGFISNTSGADAVYTIIVLSGFPIQNSSQYKLTLILGDVPPPPDPSDLECGAVDSHDSPGVGNGTLATATLLGFNTPIAGALCYSDDVDMYAFDGLAGQTITIDLPTRPADYDLTLYDPTGVATMVISATTAPAYGASVTLPSSGRYTIGVAQPNLTPTVAQYQLLVTDQHCVAGDSYEPNNTAAYAATLSNGSRVQASLCNAGDVDLYHFTATAGQQLTLNYPANATGAALRLLDSSGEIATINAGTQGQFSISSSGAYTLSVGNNSLAADNVPYRFQLLLGAPVDPPAGSPYVYYSRANDFIRADVSGGSVEPILTDGNLIGGQVIAADTVRNKLYLLTYDRRIARVNPDGTGRVNVVDTVNPNNVLRFSESLAVDEQSGQLYWVEASFGLVGRILRANADGSDVQEIIPSVVRDRGLAVDGVAGQLYWVSTDTQLDREVIRRSDLDGGAVQTVYVAPAGRQVRELAIDPFARKLYWRDPTQNRLFWQDADGGGSANLLLTVGGDARGFVVRPLENKLYYSSGSTLFSASLDGSNPQMIVQLAGSYNGVSNLDNNVFYPTTITPPGSNLVLGYGTAFAQLCGAVDQYEPNDSEATAATIGVGTITAALCTQDLTRNDERDYYQITVAAGQQISVSLTDLPQNYGLALLVDGQYVASSYQPGLVDEAVAHVNNSASPIVYTILVQRFGDTTSSRIPYTLTVAIGDPPPPPPPPPPPADNCAPYDSYDQPGILGNGSRNQATLISLNTPINAALCYTADTDYYAFDGLIGQNVTLDLPTRPADYYLTLYNPAGDYVAGIFPGSSFSYGDKVTLNATGRWTVAVWQTNLVPTVAQYQLLLSVNTACSGLDPYEPNNLEYEPRVVLTTTLTLKAMLCEEDDVDYFAFPLLAGQRIKITPRILTAGMTVFRRTPDSGFYEDNTASNQVVSSDGDYILGVHSQELQENLPYEIDIEILPVPTPTPLPNNWTCTTYPSSDIPLGIEDLTTIGSTVNVPANGTVTHVGIKDLTFNHGGLWNLSFGLAAPDGTTVDLFAFDDYGFYTWCGGDNCQLSLDDAAIEGLRPPQFPTDGNTFRPSRNSFAPFNGKASAGTWTLLVSDNFLPEPGDSDAGDTTGDLYGWGLEICVDNGNPPDPTPTPTPTATVVPQPISGTAIPTSALTATPTPTIAANVCTVTIDDYEGDDSAASASLFDAANLTSGVRTFDRATDADWMSFTALADRQYTFNANIFGGNSDILLAIWAANGTTQLAVGKNAVSFVPTTAGDYYLRASSAAGIATPCSANYSVGLTVVDPNVTPVPTAGGTPLPPGHDAPPLSAAVLSPAAGAVITTLAAVDVRIGLNAEQGIQGAEFRINDALVESYPAAPASQDLTWETSWTPPQAGVYSLAANVTDTTAMTATSATNLVYVDLAAPTVTLVADTITLSALEDDGSYRLLGTVGDDSQVDSVEVRLDGGDWQVAFLVGNEWSFAVDPATQADPNGGMLTIDVLATDKAGRATLTSDTVVVDVMPPDLFTSTVSLDNGVIISPTQVITGLAARLTWPIIPEATNIYAGWSLSTTATLAELTSYGAGAGSHAQTFPEASVRYAHVVAVDNLGNQTANVVGPFYFDSPATPDLIDDLTFTNWVDSGGKQIGQMVAERGLQKLFAGWNANWLRLRWQGLNLGEGDDLYFYLGTGAGGSSDIFNPNAQNQINSLSFTTSDVSNSTLPFAANYMIRLTHGITPTLYTYSGGWIVQQSLDAFSNGELTDVLISLADLGISNPGASTLLLLGIVTESGTLDAWATIPDQNLGQTWGQAVSFASLGAGITPADGVWADAPLAVTVTAAPVAGELVGAGDAISVTVQIQNIGNAMLPSLTVGGEASGGVTLNNTPQVASNIPPSGTVSLTLNGTVNLTGTILLTLADSYHQPYLLDTLLYAVDDQAPENVILAAGGANPGLNTAFGWAQDQSPILSFELDVNGNLIPCTASNAVPGSYVCEWDAGGATEGASFTLTPRVTDIHGNVAMGDPEVVTVDATPPQLTLSAATESALGDGYLNNRERTLTGTLTDNVATDYTELCVDAPTATCVSEPVLASGVWTLIAPMLGDGVTTTLSFVGYDLAGNANQPLTATVLVDTVGPKFGPTTIEQSVYISHTVRSFSVGTVTDGGGVANVQLYVVRPDGSSTITWASLDDTSWTGRFLFDQVGLYQVMAVASDRAGNQTTHVIGAINALYADIPPDNVVLSVRITGSGIVTPSLSSYSRGTVVPLRATASTGWSFERWSGDLITTTNPTAILMDNNKLITATFTQNSYTLITATVGAGSIQLEPAQPSYRHGDVVTMTATADIGSQFSSWSGDIVTTTNPIRVMIDANKAVTATFTRDSSPPVITPTVLGNPGHNGWYTASVTITWTVVDPESPILNQGGCDEIIITFETAGSIFTCSATSLGGATSQSVTIKLDKSAPVVQVTGVHDGASYEQGNVPVAGCSTSDLLSGVAHLAVLSVTGGNPDGTGNFRATCSDATDQAGNRASAVVNYLVVAETTTPTDTPSPTVTEEGTSEPTSTATKPTSEPDPTHATPTPTGTRLPTSTAIPTDPAHTTVTPTGTQVATAAPTDSSKVTPTPTGTWLETSTAIPTVPAQVTATPTDPPVPTLTPTKSTQATATPTGTRLASPTVPAQVTATPTDPPVPTLTPSTGDLNDIIFLPLISR